MRPPFLKAVDYSEKDLSGKNKKFLELRIHVIENCNLKCVYCLNNAPFINEKCVTRDKLNFKKIKKIIVEAKNLGVKVVGITGSGEPLLYKKLKELIIFIKTLDLKIFLFTNAIILSKSYANFFNQNEISLIVKLNSFRPLINDKLVGVIGSQKIFMKRIRMLINMGFAKDCRLGLNCIVSKENYNEIIDIFEFCRNNKIIPWICPVTITGRAKKTMIMSKQKMNNLYKKLANIDKIKYGYTKKEIFPIFGSDKRRYKYICQIDIFGFLYHDDANKSVNIGNVQHSSIYSLINSKEFIRPTK